MRRPIEDLNSRAHDGAANNDPHSYLSSCQHDNHIYQQIQLKNSLSPSAVELPNLTLVAAANEIPLLSARPKPLENLAENLVNEARRWAGHPLWMQKYITEKFGSRIFRGGQLGCAASLSFLIEKADRGNEFQGICSPSVSLAVEQMERAGFQRVPRGQERPGDVIVARGKKHIGVKLEDNLAADNSSTTHRLEIRPVSHGFPDGYVCYRAPGR